MKDVQTDKVETNTDASKCDIIYLSKPTLDWLKTSIREYLNDGYDMQGGIHYGGEWPTNYWYTTVIRKHK